MVNDLTQYEETRDVPLIGLSGTIVDLEKRETWALVKIEVGEGWEGNFMANFDAEPPDWLIIGTKIQITEKGIKLAGRQSKKCQPKANGYLNG